MAGLLSGLASLGLGKLENAKLYEDPEKKNEAGDSKEPTESHIEEKDLVYDKTFECPVCGEKITSKVMKSGKVKLERTDADLRPKYEGIDPMKYDVVLCPKCGFAAVSRYFKPMPSVQVKLIRENITKNVRLHPYNGDIYTYEEAMERYKLALACSIVKQSRASEKAYTCLKSAWVLRGWQESLDVNKPEELAKKTSAEIEEDEYLRNAMDGFISARASESFPICGMDEVTVDYLIAVLATRFGQYDTASKLVASILVSPSANARMKDKARDLKETILQGLKKKNNGS